MIPDSLIIKMRVAILRRKPLIVPQNHRWKEGLHLKIGRFHDQENGFLRVRLIHCILSVLKFREINCVVCGRDCFRALSLMNKIKERKE